MNRDHLKHYLPDLKAIQESHFSLDQRITGFHATCIDSENTPLGSGTHFNREMAHTIAVAESVERKIFESLYKSSLKSDYMLDLYPSTCGFAVGNQKHEARQRSIAEAIERWLRSKWIDDNYALVELTPPIDSFDPYQQSVFSFFDQVRAFQHTATIIFNSEPSHYHSLIVVGLKDQGAFVGSRTSLNPHDLWSHALTEAWRHLHISQNISRYPTTFDYQIIEHFAQHADQAFNQIAAATRPGLPAPNILLHKEVETPFADLFCFRTLCEDFKGWHEKDIQRFVY
ncbi:MAG: YcaO-like family protein [Bdellovibrionaceae bacterium]|nr:YcaO-like family protein [Pseudobdellovibrionaceae bacterium]